MRSSFAASLLADADGDNTLLTTGEAASLLNSSRQHVVDLCERGDLPFTTIGSHRRVRRADVEAVRTRTDRLTRDQQRSLWLAYAIAGRLVADPEPVLALARANLAQMRSASRGQAARWLDEWARLLDGPVEKILTALTATSPKARELRQNSPFAGALTDDERRRILDAWTHTRQPTR
jgi:excisionase family DNA binding protein